MNKRRFLAALAATAFVAACTTTNPSTAPADTTAKRSSINAGVRDALGKLYAQDAGSRELVNKARGVLVFPAVLSAGFVVGGSYGEGALLVGGRPVAYYSTTAAAAGLLAGAESKAMYVLFMTDEALEKFRTSNGWTAGVDASVSVLKAGANAGIDTQSANQSVVSYVLTNAGLMANLSIDGTKVQRLNV